MRITIERLRALVLIAGVLLVLSIGIFLVLSRLHRGLKVTDIPSRLGINITQQANHVVYTQSHAGHTLFKIDAAKVVQVKDGKAMLSDATIDLYGVDGSRVDQIKGKEFEYDLKAGLAKAVGPVEITMMRPGVAPAIAPNATPLHVAGAKSSRTLSEAAVTAEQGNIHVITSGLVFNQKSGVASTKERLQFSLAQGTGSAMGADFDSQQGLIVLDQSVELRVRRGTEIVNLLASHAVFDRASKSCNLRDATMDAKDSKATASEAAIHFREDGSAIQLDATDGFSLATSAGGHISAPRGRLFFDEKNHPRSGHLEGGVVLDSNTDGDTVHGTSPSADLVFSTGGVLRHAHLERGVEFASHQQQTENGVSVRTNRHWQSPVADLEFRTIVRNDKRLPSGESVQQKSTQLALASIHGTGGVVVIEESAHGAASMHITRFAAEDMDGIFDSNEVLRHLAGTGHSSIEETTSTGAHQSATGDRLEARFTSQVSAPTQTTTVNPVPLTKNGENAEIQSATLTGNVILIQRPAPTGAGKKPPATLRATAGRAEYDGAGEWLHLTLSPRVENGALQMSAERMDISRASGNAFAHGNVKATWLDENATAPAGSNPRHIVSTNGLGGHDSTHMVSAEAELHQSSDEAIFRGEARMWQGTNSIAAPVITLNRQKQTLDAEATAQEGKANNNEPLVRVAFLSAQETSADGKQIVKGSTAPQFIRLRGAELKYSAIERKAWMYGGANRVVTTETDSGKMTSDTVEMVLSQASEASQAAIRAHAVGEGKAASSGSLTQTDTPSQIDRLVARGDVMLSAGDRRGTGEQIIYSGSSGEYVLTGTDAVPPKLSDPVRGSVTGEALIFNSRDDSVSVEGGKIRTKTETRTPK